MKNVGLFSTIFLESVQQDIACTDEAQGRLVTLSQSWQRRDASGSDALWKSFIKAALGNVGFVVRDQPGSRGLYPLFEDYGFQNCIAMLYLVEPGANLDDESVGRFWPAKLITALRERKLNWGILTDGATWRLYSTKSAKPYEDHVELDLGGALQMPDETAYTLFERFFHAESFVPVERNAYETVKAKQLKALGLNSKKQKRATSGDEEEAENPGQSEEEKEREAGIYLCRLDLDGEVSEAILEARVKEPLLAQVDNVLRYICNGFIADTPRTGAAYTEEERREVFESSVKLLYRCLFLFYAEARRLLPSEERHADIYEPHSIQTLCREARKFRWNERNDTAGYGLWQQLKGLVQAVNEGDRSYGVMGYNGGLFDDEEERFLGQHRLRNDFLAHALYWLAFVDPAGGEHDDEYSIPYEDLEVRHLGEMYEAILEYKVRLADTDYIRRRAKSGWQTIPSGGQKTQDGDIRIKAGDIFFGETALERKQSGSYYTPESLVRFLVGKAVIAPLRARWESGYRERFNAYLEQTRTGYDDAARRGALRSAQELVNQFVRREILTYKVCDPAMGSGHFLVAAANLMADFGVELLAGIEPLPGVAGENTGAPNHWRRLITRHCLYGADFNPLAVNLAKLALWLNCFAREHKLTFLDLHLRAGNSLIGLRDLAALRHIPERRKDTRRDRDEAEEAAQELPLGLDDELTAKLGSAAEAIIAILDFAEDDTDRQREAFEEASHALHEAFAPLADLHTAYLVDASLRPATYARLLSHFASGKTAGELWPDLHEAWERVRTLRARHHFFHWPLEFPDIFGRRASHGFSATVGNPPWDQVQVNTQEFYERYDILFRTYDKQKALRRARELHENHPALDLIWTEFAQSFEEAAAHFKEPSAYSCLGKGKVDLFKAFVERFHQLLAPNGFIGMLTPSGLYTDEGCALLRKLLFEKSKMESLYGFENRWPEVFTAVDNRFKFITLCTQKGGTTGTFKAAFMQHGPARLAAIEATALSVSVSQIKRFSPKNLSLMEFNRQSDVDVTNTIYGDHPLLGTPTPGGWNVRFTQGLNMTSDSHLFTPMALGKQTSALWEGKNIWHFDSAFEPKALGLSEEVGFEYLGGEAWATKAFRVAFRDVAASTNERTLIATVIPPGFHGNTIPTVYPYHPKHGPTFLRPKDTVYLASVFASFVCDFVIRQKVTNHMNFFYMETLPIVRLGSGGAKDATYFWPIVARALRLICTTDEYAALWAEIFPQFPATALTAVRIDSAAYGPGHEQALRERLATSAAALTATWTPACGLHNRTPERRDTGDRAQTRAELDALIAHLYGLTKDEFAYILNTFPVLRRKELAAFGEYQSKRKALEEFEQFQP
jgi:hypothetical protein